VEKSNETRALVLSGGGSLGAFQIGAIKRLVELEKEYDMYYGTSIGAINAAGLAMFGNLADGNKLLEDLWLNIKTSDVKKHWFPFSFIMSWWKCGLYNSAPLRGYLLKHLDVDLVKKSGKKLGLCTVNLDTKKSEVFTETSDHIVDATIASSITPLFLDPIEINGHLYIDGGIRQVAPIQEAINAGATSVDVIMTDPSNKTENKVKRNLLDVGMTVIGIMAHEIANNDVANAIGNNPGIPITVIRPDEELGGGVLDFSKETIQRHIGLGYDATKGTIG